VRIRLQKRIPLAAGLGGGSSDAAATLVGLNQLWRLGRDVPELQAWAAELGSDVAFFLDGAAAWCTGRGEQVAPCPLGKRLWLVLACPPQGIATAEVYRRVQVPHEPLTGADVRRLAQEGNAEDLGRRLHNRLQESAEEIYPPVATLRRRLQELGPAGQLLSGSGSTVFALCRHRNEAVRVARRLRHGPEEEPSPTVFLVHSCT
jgi:4-diphosphocytidyl-2-C-methyl-D-erythritol kinase